MSAEAVNGRTDCGTQGIPLPQGYVPPPPPPPAPVIPGVEPERPPRPLPPANPDRFRGVRIFDISDPSNPKQVAAVQSCRGSHTHTLLIDPKDKDDVYIYISGTGNVRQPEELAGCSGGDDPPVNPNAALARIDIIKVPLARLEQAKIDSQPPHLHRCTNWSRQWSRETRQSRRRHPDHNGDRQVPRHHGVLGYNRAGRRRVFRQWNFTRYIQPCESRPRLNGTPSELFLSGIPPTSTTPTKRCCLRTSGAAAASSVAARPIQ